MQSRLQANLPGAAADAGFGSGPLPSFVVEGFSAAMSQSMLLPSAAMLVGLVTVLFIRRAGEAVPAPSRAAEAEVSAA